MKKIIVSVVFVMVATVFVFGQGAGKESDKNSKEKEEVKELVNQFVNAIKKNDTALLEKILSNDYGDIGLFNSLPTPKSLVMRLFKESKESQSEIFDLDLDNAGFHLYKDTAILTVPATVKWKYDNKGLRYLGSFVAIKKDSNWQFVMSHFSEVKVQESKQ